MSNRVFYFTIAIIAVVGGIAAGLILGVVQRSQPASPAPAPISPPQLPSSPLPVSSYEERNQLPSPEYVEARAQAMRRAQQEQMRERFAP